MKYMMKLTIAAAISVIFISCSREDILDSDSLQTHSLVAGNSAAAHIIASEKLSIPTSVAIDPSTTERVATYYAEGFQKYKATEKPGAPGVFVWTFEAPDAKLYDISNTLVGTHGAGPYWQLSSTDLIFAQHFMPMRTATSSDPESIDWLLLQPKAGTIPSGIFADVDYIQRIATKGGKAPIAPPVSISEIAHVKYKAVYRFSKNQ